MSDPIWVYGPECEVWTLAGLQKWREAHNAQAVKDEREDKIMPEDVEIHLRPTSDGFRVYPIFRWNT